MLSKKLKITVVACILVAMVSAVAALLVFRAHKFAVETAMWEDPNVDSAILETLSPRITILPSKFPGAGRFTATSSASGNVKMIGIGVPLAQILSIAYHASVRPGAVALGNAGISPAVIIPPDMPDTKYDVFANLNENTEDALQDVLKKKFGWIGKRDTVQTNGFYLKVDHANAPGFKSAGDTDFESQPHPGKRLIKNWSMDQFVNLIQGALAVPIVDKTGLTENYDFRLTAPRSFPMATRAEKVNDEMLSELGLKLVEASNLPQEVLTFQKVK